MLVLSFRPKVALVPSRAVLVTASLLILACFAVPWMTSFAEESAAPPLTLNDTEQTLLQRINEIRAAHGLQPVEVDSRLMAAARQHVADMSEHQRRSHYGTDGSSYRMRIMRTGYVAAAANEAIGWGYNMDRMINWWLNSRVHRSILLDPDYTQVGIGYVGNPDRSWGHWWVLDFATHK